MKFLTQVYLKYNPQIIFFILFLYGIHLYEEYTWDLLSWTQKHLPRGISESKFIWINTIAFIGFSSVGIWVSYKNKWRTYALCLATVFGINGILHLLGSIIYNQYCPGTFSGMLLYFPVWLLILQATSKSLSPSERKSSIILGVIIHMIVSLIAFV